MESTLHKIRSLYPEMGRAEKRIADYIFENAQSMTGYSVTQLADKRHIRIAQQHRKYT